MKEYINFETAVLLMGTDFDGTAETCYIENDTGYTVTSAINYLTKEDLPIDYYLRPTLKDVVNWLEKKKGIIIYVESTKNGWAANYTINGKRKNITYRDKVEWLFDDYRDAIETSIYIILLDEFKTSNVIQKAKAYDKA